MTRKLDHGFSLAVSLLFVFLLSMLLLAWADYERVRNRRVEKESSRFYRALEEENSTLEKEWNHEAD